MDHPDLKLFTKLPLSSNQKRLWVIAQQNMSDPGYNMQLFYRIDGEINIEILRKSLELLFERHHTLFSVFKHENEVPYIKIDRREVRLELIDFSGLDSSRDKIISHAGKLSRVPFDLEKGPLYRLHLLRENEKSYFICFIIHHIIFDGFSQTLFMDELCKIYRNLLDGVSESPEPLKLQSYHFALSEEEALTPENENNLRKFWKETLYGCPSETKIPHDFQVVDKNLKNGRREWFQIKAETSQNLRSLAKGANTTVFKTLLSVYGVFLNKITGEKDICIGIPVSNRYTEASRSVFGFFVNTIPVRFIIDEKSGFKEYLRDSVNVTGSAIRNSQLPFDKIVNELKPEKIPGVNPFFQVCFSWLKNYAQPLDLAGIKVSRITTSECVTPFNLTLYMWENGDFIEGEILYNCGVFKQETILRLRDNFLVLVDSLLRNPDYPLKSHSMITEGEKKMIEGFNDTYTDYPKDKTINQLFEEQVVLHPNKRAVVFKEKTLSYNELNEKSNQLARFLRNSGVKANEKVGLMLDKSVNMIVGIMGILKAGCAYVPLDPEYPALRKSFILLDSGCPIVVTQDKYLTDFETEITKVSLDSPLLSEFEPSNPENISTSDDLAYVIYTSGTTGNPKGTLIPHRGVVRLVLNTNCISIRPEDRVLQAQSVVFDASTLEIFGALLNGATLFVVDKGTLLDSSELEDVLTKNRITVAAFSSSLFSQLVDSHSEIFSSLKYLQVGGDILSAPHANKVRKINPELRFVNAYGPTENSCISTYYDIERDFRSHIPIGKPVSNSTAYIFDKSLNYQPVGIIGELYVGGDGLSKGYLNRDDLNMVSFIDHPYYPGRRLYKTGDMARWLPDGNIEFHGRIDSQVKIRGFRIELKEIETVLAEMDGISEAVVKPVIVGANDTRLVAFLKVHVGITIDFRKVSDHIRSKMPSYMVPSAYKALTEFPLTINGKIDIKALNIDLSQTFEDEKKSTKEFTPTQQRIAKIWHELIKTNNIGINDNFFDVGGSSFLAIWAVERIEKEFKIKLSLRVFFDSPKISSISQYVESKIYQGKNISIHDYRQIQRSESIIRGEI